MLRNNARHGKDIVQDKRTPQRKTRMLYAKKDTGMSELIRGKCAAGIRQWPGYLMEMK
ncbi:hypothetical protein LU631_24825 [Erwinia tracheiphila]|uniref:hypothetical protein n=1 Tax=Erwinia tracheiphila TaxID=65700 RepID=UPI0003A95C68|nr:hypothetical protein [Erwinia tracheiphila]UIA83385.1 hypothetical protein LU604_24365 [Erwinia tracheiphila]UIA87818.1 hypothetical protein LU631_24825 [Erwinia tracheiphila]UIA91965.1 hypothetical protein LU632_23825 [Erwinia tracheiphila]UIA96770.1 hypothetical protein LU633_01565 [Erwinia tracheiphila]